MTTTSTSGVRDEKTDDLSREELELLQLKRLRQTVAHAHANSEFWRDRLQQAKVAPEDIVSVAAYRELIPTVDKAALLADQNAAEPYGRRLAVPPEHVRATYLTSGSSGQQQEVHAQTAADLAAASQMWQTSLRWGGVRPGERAFLMVPVGLTAGPVSLFNAYQDFGLETFPVAALDGEARLKLMLRFPPNFFSCSPIYLRRLTKIAQDLDIDPRRDFPHLRTIKLGTYGFSLDWVGEMADFWGATLIDNYVSTQAGVGTTCEGGLARDRSRRALIHLLEHRGLYEIVDPVTGEEVADGEEGEVIVTPFDREAMPLLRFKTGDKVRKLPWTYCHCGRPHGGVESGTIARYDNMLKIRGMNLWTQAIDDIILDRVEVAEYNGSVVVDDLGREVVEVAIQFADDAPADVHRDQVLAELSTRIKTTTNVACRVVEGEPGTVRQIDYKERRWVDRRKERM